MWRHVWPIWRTEAKLHSRYPRPGGQLAHFTLWLCLHCKKAAEVPEHSLPHAGCDCNGPYYAYHANCVWEQTSGRFGYSPSKVQVQK